MYACDLIQQDLRSNRWAEAHVKYKNYIGDQT